MEKFDLWPNPFKLGFRVFLQHAVLTTSAYKVVYIV